MSIRPYDDDYQQNNTRKSPDLEVTITKNNNSQTKNRIASSIQLISGLLLWSTSKSILPNKDFNKSIKNQTLQSQEERLASERLTRAQL